MLFRIDSEKREFEILSELATKAANSRGRIFDEEPCEYRTAFQRDRDRIIHSKALRRLMHKTQVFLAPEGDHFRTRLTHTLEVSQISRSIARTLMLNEDLTEAIAMGHDLGHTPFGHSGETYLSQIHVGGYKHNEQSLRVVDVLETRDRGKTYGMNLTSEVRDGILNHTGSVKPFTLEGQVVKISDRIAYINHDIDDALRSNIISQSDLPQKVLAVLGESTKDRINSLVTDIVNSSYGRDEIVQSPDFSANMLELREFMFKNVYLSKTVKKDAEIDTVRNLIFSLYNYFAKSPELIPIEYRRLIKDFSDNDNVKEIVKDHIASMTDRYAIDLYKKLFVPSGWSIVN